MTEAEWLSSTAPIKMLEHLHGAAKHSERTLRFFVLACCRRVARWLLEPQQQKVLAALERFAERQISTEELDGLLMNCYLQNRDEDAEVKSVHYSAARTLVEALQSGAPNRDQPERLYDTVRHTVETAGHSAVARDPQDGRVLPAELAEHERLARILRDIVGNPFRSQVVNHSWRSYTVVTLASSFYEGNTFDSLPILADALQDAGCDNDDILNHCRQPGEHVRGCWVIDRLLDKK